MFLKKSVFKLLYLHILINKIAFVNYYWFNFGYTDNIGNVLADCTLLS